MRFVLTAAMLAATLAASTVVQAQQKAPAKTAAAPKLAKDEKLCRYRFPTGELRSWTCKKVEPCCAWDAINYVKCGSTITGCL